MKIKYQRGFSLTEVLVAVAIVGILMAVAFPSYTEHTKRTNRSDGQTALMEVASRMERYFFDNNSYTTDLQNLGYTLATNQPSAEGYYKLSVVAATTACPIATCYKVQATPQGGQADDGNLTLDSLGQKLPADKW